MLVISQRCWYLRGAEKLPAVVEQVSTRRSGIAPAVTAYRLAWDDGYVTRYSWVNTGSVHPMFYNGKRVAVQNTLSNNGMQGWVMSIDTIALPIVVTVRLDSGETLSVTENQLIPLVGLETPAESAPVVPQRPPVLCPSCGRPGAYIGLLTVECQNPSCRHAIQPAE